MFGREWERRELRDRLLRGEATVLLGLRKMGKTTLAAWVTDELADQGIDVRRADLQGLTQALTTEAIVLELVGTEGDLETLRHALDGACEQGPVVLFIDEFDYLFTPRARVDLVGLFGVLRAVAQATGRLGVVFSGRDPRAMTAPLLAGAPNPFLAWTRPLWLGGLEQAVAESMLQSIGTRVGLRVDRSLTDFAWRWSAGHPLAHRWVGSAALKAVQRTGRVPPVPTAEFVAALPAVLERDRDQRLLAREVDEVLPDGSRELLAAAASGAQELEGDADDLDLLEDLGVLVPGRSPAVPGYLTAWYRRRRRRVVKLSA